MLIVALAFTPTHVAASESSASADPHVALIGASYAAGWSDLRIAGFTVRNYGLGGANTTQMLESLRKLEDAPERPRAVIVWGFINEFSQSGLQNLPEVHARVQSNWLEMIAIAERLGAVVILATEVTIRHPEGFGNDTMSFIGALMGKESYQQRINAEVMKANVWVRKLGRERQFTVLDLQPLLADENGYRIKKYAQPDGGHLSAEAYRTLTARLTPVISQALR